MAELSKNGDKDTNVEFQSRELRCKIKVNPFQWQQLNFGSNHHY